MKNIWMIARKELNRFFGDRRMMLTTLFLPAIMIYAVYSFMGDALMEQFSVSEDFRPAVAAVNLPESVGNLAREMGFEMEEIEAGAEESVKSEIASGEGTALAVFPEEFDRALQAENREILQIELYYNSTNPDSDAAYSAFLALLDGYETSLANVFDVNAGSGVYDLASQKDLTGTIFASMLPMLLTMFLFSGCMAVAPESIAGEKERGTIATLLITPIRRRELAIGKILALALIALLSGTSSAAGTLLALPKLMGGAAGEMSAAYYTMQDYAFLALLILSTVLLMITVISVISAFSKSVKEASTYVTPLMIAVMLVGVTAMFGGGAASEIWAYLIPFYNSVQCMSAIFSFEMNVLNLGVTMLSNLVYAGALVVVLTKMFESENMMFRR